MTTAPTNDPTDDAPATDTEPDDSARLAAILRLVDGRPGYHTVTVKQLLTAGWDEETAEQHEPGGTTEYAIAKDGDLASTEYDFLPWTSDHGEAVARLARYRDAWPNARVAQRRVYRGQWTADTTEAP